MSADSESLSSILAGSSALVPSAQAEPAKDVISEPVKAAESAVPSTAKDAIKPEKSEPEKASTRDESGRFAKSEVKAEKPEPMVPLSALLAERAKRQQPEVARPKTSVLEDEDKAFSERTDDAVAPLRETIFEMSMEMGRARHEDFDDVAKVFTEAAELDTRLWQQMREARNPGAYVYSVGLQFRELGDVGGDIIKYRDKVTSTTKAELAAKDERIKALESELAATKKAETELAAVPRSLNSSPSGAAPQTSDADPEDIRNIVRFKG